jgi:type VI protein secretion system component Hcp
MREGPSGRATDLEGGDVQYSPENRPKPERTMYKVFVKFEGVNGESEQHVGWSDVTSFSFGASNVSRQPEKLRKTSVRSFSLTKPLDSASASLYVRCLSGKAFDKVELRCIDGNDDLFWDLTFLSALIVDHSFSGTGANGESDRPSESIAFDYGSTITEYRGRKAGKLAAVNPMGWNVKEDKQA